MKFQADHDLHIHTKLSSCSSDPEQTTENILRYAEETGLKTVCVTDHFWDAAAPGEPSPWYRKQDFSHIRQSLPLPHSDRVRFLFGGETELDRHFHLAVTDKTLEQMDFLIIPTTHLHMTGLTLSEEDAASPDRRAQLWIDRLDAVLRMDLPFEKIGIAHLTCPNLAPGNFTDHVAVLDRLSDAVLNDVFRRVASRGAGVELNFPIFRYDEETLPRVLRVFLAAKRQGCKFYLGGDAHHPDALRKQEAFEEMIRRLDLTEDDKFPVARAVRS